MNNSLVTGRGIWKIHLSENENSLSYVPQSKGRKKCEGKIGIHEGVIVKKENCCFFVAVNWNKWENGLTEGVTTLVNNKRNVLQNLWLDCCLESYKTADKILKDIVFGGILYIPSNPLDARSGRPITERYWKSSTTSCHRKCVTLIRFDATGTRLHLWERTHEWYFSLNWMLSLTVFHLLNRNPSC